MFEYQEKKFDLSGEENGYIFLSVFISAYYISSNVRYRDSYLKFICLSTGFQSDKGHKE